ncbi:MAG: CehA/McbA family metallohydrolase [Armatimonadota bacterium]
MTNPFTSDGQWFKGNLHLHTTESDGEMEPQEAIDSYAERGYDFLSITDHRRVTDPGPYDDRGMLLIPGIEFDGARSDMNSSYHIVGIGAEPGTEHPSMSGDNAMEIQEMVDYINENSEFCFSAHPSWSSLTIIDLVDVEGLIGVEVYNTTCDRGVGRGYSAVQWDALLARGKRLYGFAVDDAHNHYDDAWTGFIMVRAEECTEDSIISAIKNGQFYASNGPEIHHIQIEDTEVIVECSPCQQVNVVCPYPGRGSTSWRVSDAPPYEHIRLPRKTDSHVFRIECIDSRGRVAWSNPVWP